MSFMYSSIIIESGSTFCNYIVTTAAASSPYSPCCVALVISHVYSLLSHIQPIISYSDVPCTPISSCLAFSLEAFPFVYSFPTLLLLIWIPIPPLLACPLNVHCLCLMQITIGSFLSVLVYFKMSFLSEHDILRILL